MRHDAALGPLFGELLGQLSHLAERVRTAFVRTTGVERWPACLRLLAFPAVAATYVSLIARSTNISAQVLYMCIALYVVFALVTLVALIHSTAHRQAYRIAGLSLDILAITALVLGAHQHGVFFVQFYVITCVGHGLRYGKPLLLCATWGSTVAFMVVLNFSTYWQEHVQLGAGLFLSVLLLPLLAYKINARVRKLRSAVEQKKHEYLVTTSHEIRTSVNAIMGLADLLKESSLSPEQSDWVHALTATGEVLLSLVGNVLEKAQTEAGKMPIRHSPFVLSSVVKNVFILLRTSADQKGIGLSYDIAVGPHIHTLIGDRYLISQILINLMENAIKFTDRGGVLLRVTQEASCSPHQVTLLWEVIDTGPGIPADAVHEIFDPFSRVSGPHKAHKNGTGLGAMIAKDLAQQMGGEMGVTTELHKGTTFWFRLNLGLPTQIPVPSEATPSSGEEVHFQRNPVRLLLVDDNRTNRTVTTRVLEKLGHIVTGADSGTAALAHIAATQFDLVLLDMEMPGIGGLEVLVRTQQLPDKEWIPPIFVLTAHDSYEAKVACKTAGAAGFLTKPITANRLQHELANVCRRTHDGEDSTSERAVDASRLSDQLALSHGDFSYVNELIANWKCDYAQSIDHLERSADAHDFESIRHILHNVESGAREVGAHKIADICRSQRKTITPATAHVLASIQRSLQTAYTDTLVVFARLDALLQSPRHTQSIHNAHTQPI